MGCSFGQVKPVVRRAPMAIWWGLRSASVERRCCMFKFLVLFNLHLPRPEFPAAGGWLRAGLRAAAKAGAWVAHTLADRPVLHRQEAGPPRDEVDLAFCQPISALTHAPTLRV
jgi:hypothetical protein